MTQRVCWVCDAPLQKKPGKGRWPGYCGDACSMAARLARSTAGRLELRQVERSCARCESPFIPTPSGGGPAPIRCPSCASEGRSPAKDRRCELCGVGAWERPGCWSRFCQECRPEGTRNNAHIQRQRRRARLAGVAVERVDRRQVFDRDGWICGLCTSPVDPTLEYPSPGSASLDHVMPISLGGPHSYDNTQLAHLRCNLKKHNRAA